MPVPVEFWRENEGNVMGNTSFSENTFLGLETALNKTNKCHYSLTSWIECKNEFLEPGRDLKCAL